MAPDKDKLEAEEGLNHDSPDPDIYPDATVKISRDQYSAFEIKRMAEETGDLIIEPPTPERVKYDIFDRVNRGGTQLNHQEMRNALYQGHSTKLLEKFSRSDSFKQATGNGVKAARMRDRYIILRFFAFYMQKTGDLKFNYRSNIGEFRGRHT